MHSASTGNKDAVGSSKAVLLSKKMACRLSEAQFAYSDSNFVGPLHEHPYMYACTE